MKIESDNLSNYETQENHSTEKITIKNIDGKDLTKGNLLKNMAILLIPLFLTNLLNSIYSLVDGIWIGNLIGETGVSVVTNCYPITYIVTSIATGLSIATSVLVSQYYGAKEDEKIKSVVGGSYFLTAIIGCVVPIIMMLTSTYLLKILKTPSEIFDVTQKYFVIYLIGFVFNFFLTVIMEEIRAIGNSKTPLMLVGISTGINLVLDPIFIKLGWGITGTAIATLIAMIIGTLLAIVFVNRNSNLLKINFKYIRYDKEVTLQIFKIGIPIIIENWFLAGVMSLELYVSNLGGIIGNAGYGVARKIEDLIAIISTSFQTMATVTTGQFIGIKKIKESINVLKNGLKLSIIPILFIFIISFVIPKQFCKIFVSSEEVISMAIIYLSSIRISYIILPACNLLHGFIMGTGHTKFALFSVTVSSIVEVIVILVLKNSSMNSLAVLGTSVLMWVFTRLILDLIFFFSNKWQKEVIKK